MKRFHIKADNGIALSLMTQNYALHRKFGRIRAVFSRTGRRFVAQKVLQTIALS